VDAPFESKAASGVNPFFPPPYYTFWRGTDPRDVKGAHAWLLDLLDRQGPYDGVVCFSQGCALISSFILYHKNERPEEPLPFAAAIFICGGIPLAVLENLGLPVSAESWEINNRTGRELQKKAGAAAEKIRAIEEGGMDAMDARRGLWYRTDTLEQDPLDPFPTDRTNVFGLNFTRFPETLKITIPTVHIYGNKDPRYPASIQLAHFSEESKRRIYDHAGGHEIPRTTVVSNHIADLVKWLESKTME
jgi:pimeloyl-ACP methyl ester carboxylesterase